MQAETEDGKLAGVPGKGDARGCWPACKVDFGIRRRIAEHCRSQSRRQWVQRQALGYRGVERVAATEAERSRTYASRTLKIDLAEDQAATEEMAKPSGETTLSGIHQTEGA